MNSMIDDLPICVKCRKPVDGIIVDYIPFSSSYVYTVYCHGEKEVLRSNEKVHYVFNVSKIKNSKGF